MITWELVVSLWSLTARTRLTPSNQWNVRGVVLARTHQVTSWPVPVTCPTINCFWKVMLTRLPCEVSLWVYHRQGLRSSATEQVHCSTWGLFWRADSQVCDKLWNGHPATPLLYHEEVDTRIVLHAIDQSLSHSRIVVRCDDTDVLVILLCYYNVGLLTDDVYMHAGHSGKVITRERYIPVHTNAGKLGDNVCQCLPAVHALTGCNTTRALFRIGKRTAFTTLVENADALHELSQLGASPSLNSLLQSATLFISTLIWKAGQGGKHSGWAESCSGYNHGQGRSHASSNRRCL